MPKEFENCVAGGGRVRTMSGPNKKFGLSKGQFRRICFPKGSGSPTLGEVKTSKKAQKAGE